MPLQTWYDQHPDWYAESKTLLASGDAYECERVSRDGKTGKVIMFKMPKEGTIEFDDIVKGHMAKKAEDIQDFAIVRSDGSPIFHIANVVDDPPSKSRLPQELCYGSSDPGYRQPLC